MRGQDRLVVDDVGAIAATRSYFREGPWRSDNPAGVRGRVPVHHRTLATLCNAFTGAGLVLDRLAEPQPAGALAERLARFREQPALLLARIAAPEHPRSLSQKNRERAGTFFAGPPSTY